jgi:hypothetical protein
LSAPLNRPENQNHTLSRATGPPTPALTSQFFLTSFGVPRPAALSSSVKLLPCRAPFEKVKKVEPLNVLPPSRGMKLMRTPPVGSSAETAV